MKRAKWFGLLWVAAGLASVVGFVVVLQRVVYGASPSNRFAIYAIQTELRKGMQGNDVAAAVDRHRVRRMYSGWNADRTTLTVWTPLGWYEGDISEVCLMTLRFQAGKLESSTIRSGDEPHRGFQDAPPDLQ